MKIKFWGVRGSIPCPGPETVKYGGNTSCLQVLGGQEIIILDAGTGLRKLGLELSAQKRPLRIHLLLTHTHWDHIQGFPFFTPIYFPGNELFVYGPRALEKSLEEALMAQMQYSYFPVRGVELAARVRFTELGEETFSIGDVEFATKSMNHPIRVLAYRFGHKGHSAVFTGDNEPYYDVLAERAPRSDTGVQRRSEFISECNQRVVDFCRKADLLVADAQYTDAEYKTKRGWGHSSVSHVLALARDAGVRALAIFHHEPEYDDRTLDRIEREARALSRKLGGRFKLVMAREGRTVDA